jgi:ABC-2 type transport system permease protein
MMPHTPSTNPSMRSARATFAPLWAATRLVAGREIAVRLRDKTFLFSTMFFLLLAAGGTILPAVLSGASTSTVAVAQPDAASALDRAGIKVVRVPDAHRAEKLVRDGEADAAVVAGDVPGGVRVLAMDSAPDDVIAALSTVPAVELLDPNAVSPVLAYLIPLAFGMVFFFTSLTFGIQIAQSVTEEKQTRIVEILVAAVPVRALLAGKVLGNGALALAQIVLIGLVSVVSMRAVDAGAILAQLGPSIGWFIPFFLVGFVLLASMWAVTGALVSRQEDINAASMPVQMAIMLPFFGVIFLNGNPLAMTVLSYVPFSAPTAMPLRLFFGQAAGWEPIVALVILLGTAVLFLALAARLYEGSLLRTNGRTSLRTAWRQREASIHNR